MQSDFRKLAERAKRVTNAISPEDAYKLLKESPNAILIETRDPDNVPEEDIVNGSIIISMDKLVESYENATSLSDCDPRLSDKDVVIVTT